MCRLAVRGAASTDLLLRVVGVVAVRGLLLQRVAAVATGEEMVIELDVPGLAGHLADAAIEKIRTFVDVVSVEASRGGPNAVADG